MKFQEQSLIACISIYECEMKITDLLKCPTSKMKSLVKKNILFSETFLNGGLCFKCFGPLIE